MGIHKLGEYFFSDFRKAQDGQVFPKTLYATIVVPEKFEQENSLRGEEEKMLSQTFSIFCKNDYI